MYEGRQEGTYITNSMYEGRQEGTYITNSMYEGRQEGTGERKGRIYEFLATPPGWHEASVYLNNQTHTGRKDI